MAKTSLTAQAKNDIATAVNDAIKLIASQAESARAVVANNAAEAVKVLAVKSIDGQSDHDLLQRLDTKVDSLKCDIADLKKDKEIFVTQTDHAEVIRVQRLHDDEIKVLQSFKDTLTGKMVMMGAMSGFVVGVIMMIIQYLINRL